MAYDAEIAARLGDVRELLILHQPGYPLRALGLFYALSARLEELLHPAAVPESAYPEAVRNAIVYLQENFQSPYNAAATAATVSLSQSHLRALFEKWVGESPHRFHTRCRIDQARRLLSEQKLPVSQVALLVGLQRCALLLPRFQAVRRHCAQSVRPRHLTRVCVSAALEPSPFERFFSADSALDRKVILAVAGF